MTDMALKNAVLLILPLIFSLSLSHTEPTSVGWASAARDDSKQKELVIGSRPPQCVNKCLTCRPCVAALVISQRHRQGDSNMDAARLPKDDAYYLLSWKCKCKDKYFQP